MSVVLSSSSHRYLAQLMKLVPLRLIFERKKEGRKARRDGRKKRKRKKFQENCSEYYRKKEDKI